MQKQIQTPVALSPARVELETAEQAVHTMDRLSQHAFDEIQARTASLRALVANVRAGATFDTAAVLREVHAIAEAAGDGRNCINVEACNIGMGFDSTAAGR